MNRKIILTEEQEKQLIGMLVKESASYPVEPDKVIAVKNYLDKTFTRANYTDMKGGQPHVQPIALFKNPETGEAMEKMPLLPRQVFDNVEAYFKNIYEDKVRRTKFLQQVIKDWFYKRINAYGQLSVNNY